jgi:hypothetical protein
VRSGIPHYYLIMKIIFCFLFFEPLFRFFLLNNIRGKKITKITRRNYEKHAVYFFNIDWSLFVRRFDGGAE